MYENNIEKKHVSEISAPMKVIHKPSTSKKLNQFTIEKEATLPLSSPKTNQVSPNESWIRMVNDPLVTILKHENILNKSISSNPYTIKSLKHEVLIKILLVHTKIPY